MRPSNHTNTLNEKTMLSQRLRNIFHSVALVGGVSLVFGLTGYLLLGGSGLLFGLGLMLAVSIFGPRLSPKHILRWMGARPVREWEAPRLYHIVDRLAQRAQLKAPPTLFLLPDMRPNAFAMGNKEEPYLGVTEGLLHRLNEREIEGVLAHEVAHIQNNDLQVMGLAEQLGRMTSFLSTFGLIVLFFMFPVMLFTGQTISGTLLLVLLLGPPATRLLLLALSRTREFEADRQAAALTGDPRGLHAALKKLDEQQRPWWQRVFFPQARSQEPSFLRTHPVTEERLARLQELQSTQATTREPEVVIEPPIHRRRRTRRRASRPIVVEIEVPSSFYRHRRLFF